MFGTCLVFGLQMCVRCCQPFVSGAASGVSDVNPNGHVLRLSIVGCCQTFVAEASSSFFFFFWFVVWFFLSVLWYLRLTIVCWLGSIRLLVSGMDLLCVHVDIVVDPSDFCF